MLYKVRRHKTIAHTIAIFIVITLTAPNQAFANPRPYTHTLAPTTPLSPICKVVPGIGTEITFSMEEQGTPPKDTNYLRKKAFFQRVKNNPAYRRLYGPEPFSDYLTPLQRALEEVIKNSFDSFLDEIEELHIRPEDFTGKIIIEAFYEKGEMVINIINNGKTVILDEKGMPMRQRKGPEYFGGMGIGIEESIRQLDFLKCGDVKWYQLKNGTKVQIRIPKNKMPKTFQLNEDEIIVIKGGEEDIRKIAAFRDISAVIGQFLHLDLSEHASPISLVKQHIDAAELALSKTGRDPLLAGFEIDELTYDKKNRACHLPLYRNGVKKFQYKFYIDGDEKTADWTIPAGKDKNGNLVYVYVDVEMVELPLAEQIEQTRQGGQSEDKIKLLHVVIGIRDLYHGQAGNLTTCAFCLEEFMSPDMNISSESRRKSDDLFSTLKDLKDNLMNIHQKVLNITFPEDLELEQLIREMQDLFDKSSSAPSMLRDIKETFGEESHLLNDMKYVLDDFSAAMRELLDSVKGPIKLEEVNLNELIDKARIKENIGADDGFISKWEADFSGSEKIIKFPSYYKNLLACLFSNLLNNAEVHGILGKPKEDRKDGVIKASSKIEGENIVVTIRDNGAGVPEEACEIIDQKTKKQRVFTREYSSHKSEELPWHGMGLALCWDIVTIHNGTITVDSEPGKGTTFTITLPAESNPRTPNPGLRTEGLRDFVINGQVEIEKLDDAQAAGYASMYDESRASRKIGAVSIDGEDATVRLSEIFRRFNVKKYSIPGMTLVYFYDETNMDRSRCILLNDIGEMVGYGGATPLSDNEMGFRFQIFQEFRREGYGEHALKLILNTVYRENPLGRGAVNKFVFYYFLDETEELGKGTAFDGFMSKYGFSHTKRKYGREMIFGYELEMEPETISVGKWTDYLAEILASDEFPQEIATLEDLFEYLEKERPEILAQGKTREEKMAILCLAVSNEGDTYAYLVSQVKRKLEAGKKPQETTQDIYQQKLRTVGDLYKEAKENLRTFEHVILPPGKYTAFAVIEHFGYGYEHIREGRFSPDSKEIRMSKEFFELCCRPEKRKFVGKWEKDYAQKLTKMTAAELQEEWDRLGEFNLPGHPESPLYGLSATRFPGDTRQYFHPAFYGVVNELVPSGVWTLEQAEEVLIYYVAKMDIYLEWALRHWEARLSRDVPRHFAETIDLGYVEESVALFDENPDTPFEESPLCKILTRMRMDYKRAVRILELPSSGHGDWSRSENNGPPNLLIMKDENETAQWVAREIVEQVKQNPRTVLGLATGGTQIPVYREIVRITGEENIDWSGVTIFNLDEYWGMEPDHPETYRNFMGKHLLNELIEFGLKTENAHIPDTSAENPKREISDYIDKIHEAGGVDLWLLGIGSDGHYAFLEPAVVVRSDQIDKEDSIMKDVRDFNEFVIPGDICADYDSVKDLVTAILDFQRMCRSDLGAYPDLVEKKAASELRMLGSRMLGQSDIAFYVPLTPEERTELQEEISRYYANVHILGENDYFANDGKVTSLAVPTIIDNSRFFDSLNEVPLKAMTLTGIVREGKRIIQVVTGQGKMRALADTVSLPVTPEVPSTILREHPHYTVVADENAASLITHVTSQKKDFVPGEGNLENDEADEIAIEFAAEEVYRRSEKGFHIFDSENRELRLKGKEVAPDKTVIVKLNEKYHAHISSCITLIVFSKEGIPAGITHSQTSAFLESDLDGVRDLLTPDNYFLVVRGPADTPPHGFQQEYIVNLLSYLEYIGIPEENVYCHESEYYESFTRYDALEGLGVEVSAEEGVRIVYADMNERSSCVFGAEVIRRDIQGFEEVREDEPSAGLPETTPEFEQIHAKTFSDIVRIIQAQEAKGPVIFALGTSWIKGYEPGHRQHLELNPLIRSLRRYCKKRGIAFIDRDDADLLRAIEEEKKKEGMENAKIVVLADENTVKSPKFGALRGDKNAFLAGVDNKELTPESFMRVMQMMNKTMKLALIKFGYTSAHFIWVEEMGISKKYDKECPDIYIFLPDAEPKGYEKFKERYEVQQFA